MTAVAQEMLELAERLRRCRDMRTYEVMLSTSELELAEIALRESALSRNEVVGERMI